VAGVAREIPDHCKFIVFTMSPLECGAKGGFFAAARLANRRVTLFGKTNSKFMSKNNRRGFGAGIPGDFAALHEMLSSTPESAQYRFAETHAGRLT
jgi:hypothetical protein